MSNASLAPSPHTLLLSLDAMVRDDAAQLRALISKTPSLMTARESGATMTNHFYHVTSADKTSGHVGLVLEDTPVLRALARDLGIEKCIYWGCNQDPVMVCSCVDAVTLLLNGYAHTSLEFKTYMPNIRALQEAVRPKQTRLVPDSYPSRASVGVDLHDWSDPAYKPVVYADPKNQGESRPAWADADHVPFLEMLERLTIDREGVVVPLKNGTLYDFKAGRFLNPRGKTGIAGRGALGQWGPNWAADVIVTKEDEGELWVLLCEKTTGDGESALCFPAGMVEAGERVPQTLRRELCEEAVQEGDVVSRLFEECEVGCVYAGHVDDQRNTDHAWMVTQAYRFHATPEIAAGLCLGVKDTAEIKKSFWVKAKTVSTMYASHKDWLDKVIATHDSGSPIKKMRSA